MNRVIQMYAQGYDYDGRKLLVCPPEWHLTEPTTLLSKAIEQVEQMGDYKVMVALANPKDFRDGKPKEDCLYTFTDIKSKKLREVIYKEMEMTNEQRFSSIE